MASITIRIRSDEDRESIEHLKKVTRDRTAAKALMRAARLYPDAREELRRAQDRLAAVQADLERLQSALADWQRAHDLERSARRRLEDLSPVLARSPR